MILNQLPEVQRLSFAEKWELIDELWKEVEESLSAEPPDPDVVSLLRERMSEFERNPSTGVSWDDLKKRLRT